MNYMVFANSLYVCLHVAVGASTLVVPERLALGAPFTAVIRRHLLSAAGDVSRHGWTRRFRDSNRRLESDLFELLMNRWQDVLASKGSGISGH